MEFVSKVPQLREITYSYSPHSDIITGVGDDELSWIEGEHEQAFCTNVNWVSLASDDLSTSYSGTLILSNFRLRFLPDDAKLKSLEPLNKLLSRFDVVLYNVESIYKVKKKKKKLLHLDCLLKEKVERLEIVCKSFQTILFDLQSTNEDDNQRMIYLLIHAVVAAQTDSLMVYAKHPDEEYVEESNLESYWSNILDKCGEKSYRAVTCNESFHVTDSLPKTFVVPSSLSPKDVVAMATNFVNNRCPCWTYSCKSSGSALVRMSYKAPGVQSNVEERMYDSMRSSHPYREYPRVFDLTSELPSFNEVQSSYSLLQQLCVFDTTRQWSDSRWLSQLEACRWLEMVSRCLGLSKDISTVLSMKGLSVVVREYSSTDLSPLVSSLVQLMLEEECRTTAGFQDLIKKEWLAQGHKFGARLQSKSFGMGNDSCPYFLLFLDCVFQLVRLRPESFEFNSGYLLLVWQTACQGLFRDLLFNSPKDLFYTTMKIQLEFRNGTSGLLRRNQLNRSLAAGSRSEPRRRGRLDSGVVGTLVRKSHLDFSGLRKHMTSLTNLSQSQSMFSSPSWESYDSYSLKKSRSKLSRLSTLSINRESTNRGVTPSSSRSTSNVSASQLQLATPTSACSGSSDWSEFSTDLKSLRKSSLSQQRLDSSQHLLNQSDVSYENPWTDLIGEIGRGGSALLFDWSFLYDARHMIRFKSFDYLASRLRAKTEMNGVPASRSENGWTHRSPATTTVARGRNQKSAIIIGGRKIYASFPHEAHAQASASIFLKTDYSVPRLTFWSSCHLRFHPRLSPARVVRGTSGRNRHLEFADGLVDDDDVESQSVFVRLATEIQELEKCLGSGKVQERL